MKWKQISVNSSLLMILPLFPRLVPPLPPGRPPPAATTGGEADRLTLKTTTLTGPPAQGPRPLSREHCPSRRHLLWHSECVAL